jgi:phospholipase/carboxylesterase
MEAAVVRRLSVPGAAFVLPVAGDRCWYSALAVAPLEPATRAELGRSLADLAALVTTLRAEAPGVPLVLAGFSQGACLSLEHAFAGQAVPDAVVSLTGCRVGVASDDRPSRLAAGLPAYLSAGQDDPWIPVAAFAQAAAELGRGGAALRTDVFPARPHEVSAAEVTMLASALSDLAAGHTPGFGAAR